MVTTHTSIFHTQKPYSRNALMCFGWSPQQSEVISSHRIGQLVFKNRGGVSVARHELNICIKFRLNSIFSGLSMYMLGSIIFGGQKLPNPYSWTHKSDNRLGFIHS